MDRNAFDYLLTEEFLNEKTVVSYHKKPVDIMVSRHKEKLNTNNSKIIHHKTFKDGSHEILHKTPTNKLRTIVITQAQRRGLVTKVVNKPAPVSVRQKHSVR